MRRAIGRFQRLCCLGPGGQALMPGLLSVLSDIVPNSNRQVFWFDPQRKLTNTYWEGPCIDLAPRYLAEAYGTAPSEIASFAEVMQRRERPAGDFMRRFVKLPLHDFRRGEFYNQILRPGGMVQGINLGITAAGQPTGQIFLWRTDREPAFASRDLRVLDALHGFIAHAMHDRPTEEAFTDTDDHACVIVDHDGRLMHMSAEARRLLLMALVPRWTPQTVPRKQPDPILELVQLCRGLSAACSDALPRAPPVLRRRNGWGEFVLRAYWLGAVHPTEVSRYIGVIIERREPRSLALLRKVEALNLSEREKQLCLLLARGEDTASAARGMGVSEHTIIAHRRNLYAKLGITGRLALLDRLHAG
jgi:DNA-binding CsgD family transcriptional regulator